MIFLVGLIGSFIGVKNIPTTDKMMFRIVKMGFECLNGKEFVKQSVLFNVFFYFYCLYHFFHASQFDHDYHSALNMPDFA